MNEIDRLTLIAARKTTIARAAQHLLEAPRREVLKQLATTGFEGEWKSDPEALAMNLIEGLATPDAMTFVPWKAAQSILQAADLPHDLEHYKDKVL
jgi:hypothetical protein